MGVQGSGCRVQGRGVWCMNLGDPEHARARGALLGFLLGDCGLKVSFLLGDYGLKVHVQGLGNRVWGERDRLRALRATRPRTVGYEGDVIKSGGGGGYRRKDVGGET